MRGSEREFRRLEGIIKELRGENGCPWDKKQTVLSLERYLREEFDELLLALANNDPENLCEEAGDMLFLLLMIAEISSEQNLFTPKDVLHCINEKLVRRHPHVFAGAKIADEKELREQWEAIKAEEKAKRN